MEKASQGHPHPHPFLAPAHFLQKVELSLGEVVEKDTAKDLLSTACVPGWGTTEVRSPALAPDL